MKEQRIPFPQANDIYKVLYYFFSVVNYKIPEYLSFVEFAISDRQVSYYKNGALYLGLLNHDKTPTKEGKFFLDCSKSILLRLTVLMILKKKIFSNYYHNRDDVLTIELIKKNNNLNLITAKRRLNTVKAWIKWCDIIVEFDNEG